MHLLLPQNAPHFFLDHSTDLVLDTFLLWWDGDDLAIR